MFFADQFHLIFYWLIQFFKIFSIDVSWPMRIAETADWITSPTQSHWLIRAQLKEVNSSVKYAMQLVSSKPILLIVKSKWRTWKDLMAQSLAFLLMISYILLTAQIAINGFKNIFDHYFHFFNFFDLIDHFEHAMLHTKMSYSWNCLLYMTWLSRID